MVFTYIFYQTVWLQYRIIRYSVDHSYYIVVDKNGKQEIAGAQKVTLSELALIYIN